VFSRVKPSKTEEPIVINKDREVAIKVVRRSKEGRAETVY